MQVRSAVFLHKVANRQTDKQRRKHNLLGGGNEIVTPTATAQKATQSNRVEVTSRRMDGAVSEAVGR